MHLTRGFCQWHCEVTVASCGVRRRSEEEAWLFRTGSGLGCEHREDSKQGSDRDWQGQGGASAWRDRLVCLGGCRAVCSRGTRVGERGAAQPRSADGWVSVL